MSILNFRTHLCLSILKFETHLCVSILKFQSHLCVSALPGHCRQPGPAVCPLARARWLGACKALPPRRSAPKDGRPGLHCSLGRPLPHLKRSPFEGEQKGKVFAEFDRATEPVREAVGKPQAMEHPLVGDAFPKGDRGVQLAADARKRAGARRGVQALLRCGQQRVRLKLKRPSVLKNGPRVVLPWVNRAPHLFPCTNNSSQVALKASHLF